MNAVSTYPPASMRVRMLPCIQIYWIGKVIKETLQYWRGLEVKFCPSKGDVAIDEVARFCY